MFSYNPSLKDTRHKLLFSSIIVFIYLINICMPTTFKVLSRRKKKSRCLPLIHSTITYLIVTRHHFRYTVVNKTDNPYSHGTYRNYFWQFYIYLDIDPTVSVNPSLPVSSTISSFYGSLLIIQVQGILNFKNGYISPTPKSQFLCSRLPLFFLFYHQIS